MKQTYQRRGLPERRTKQRPKEETWRVGRSVKAGRLPAGQTGGEEKVEKRTIAGGRKKEGERDSISEARMAVRCWQEARLERTACLRVRAAAKSNSCCGHISSNSM